MKIAYFEKNNLFIFQFGKTSNKKISDGKSQIVQTYTFSREQFELIKSGKYSFKEFFNLDGSNCMDCGFSSNQGYKLGKCYTHKVVQYFGFVSMLKSLNIQDIKESLTDDLKNEIIDNCLNKYVRFGTYGEPSLIDYSLVSDISKVAKNYTGYTHQYQKYFAQKYASFFMASVHSLSESIAAESLNFRSFIVTKNEQNKDVVICPASKESNLTTCQKCALCSGAIGKGKKNVIINYH